MPFIKGKSGNPNGRPEGAKGKATILKEERRAIFDERIGKKWEKVIDKLKPEYVADQYMGKAEEVGMLGTGNIIMIIPTEVIKRNALHIDESTISDSIGPSSL